LNFILSNIDIKKAKNGLSKALIAVMDNDNFGDMALLLMAKGADPAYDRDEKYALCRLAMLHSSKEKYCLKVMRKMIRVGAYINRFSEDMETPLMMACEKKDLPMVKLLMELGANPHLQNKNAITAFDLAKGNSKCLQILKGKKISLIPKRVGKVPASKGAASSFTNPFAAEESKLELMRLSMAASGGKVNEVKELLASGVNPNKTLSADGLPPLLQAKNAAIARLLIKAGADVSYVDANGWNALHHAVTRKSDGALVYTLIKSGCKINQRARDGKTPLMTSGILFTEKIAPQFGKTLVPLLIQAGANINEYDNNGHTLLHQAVFNDNAELAEVCLMMDANPDLKTPGSATPRKTAEMIKSKKVLAIFKR
jgi:ankyrin repeat protein